MFINKNSKISIVDNTGTVRLRSILFYRNRSGYVGDLHVGSLNKVKARRKFKKGQIFRAILVQTRRWTYRALGSYIRSLATRAILIKKTEFMPLANRLNGFFFLELKNSGEFKFTSLTVYVVLFLHL
jgi:ribosomal protein L14